MKKNKFFSIVLCLALLVSMLPAAAFAAPAQDYPFTIILGTKAYDQMALAKPEFAAEIKAAFIANSNKFFWVKADKTIIDNFGAAVDLATLPKNITLKKGDGTQTMINEGEESLQVISISAINATTIEVKFNGKVDSSKVTVNNFTVLDKESQVINPTAAVHKLEEGKSVVTLTVAALSAEKAPYQMVINKEAFGLSANIMAIELPAADVMLEKVLVVDGKNIQYYAKAALGANPNPATDITIVDLTDSTNKAKATLVSPAVPASDKARKVTVDTEDFFKAGHNYKITFEREKLVDVFGNKNKEDYSFEFTAEKNEAAPKLTKVSVMKSLAANQVVALLEFDMAVKNVAGNVDIYLETSGAPQFKLTSGGVIEAGGDAHAEIKDLTKVPDNQIVLTNLVGGAMDAEKDYQVYLGAGEVSNTTLDAVKNEYHKAPNTVKGVDLTVPTQTEGTLVSATEIKLQFSEPVDYVGPKVEIAGFDATGGAAAVEALVEMSADKKTATLTVKEAGEKFATSVAGATITYAEGAFEDSSKNKIAAAGGVAINGAVDKAAPVAVKADFTDGGSEKIDITFTENAVLGEELDVSVNGVKYGYLAAIEDGKWNVTANKVKIQGADNAFAAGASVELPAKVVKDAAGNKSTVLSIVAN